MRIGGISIKMICILITLSMLGCYELNNSSDDDVDEIKSKLQASKYISEDMHETGIDENGEVFGYWYLSFSEDQVCWDYSDIGEDCHIYEVDADAHISAMFGTGNVIEGDYDSTSGRLKWDGFWYIPVFNEIDDDILTQNNDGNFVLYVSNQSYAITPVDITIHIDGKLAVSSDFEVHNQHNWIEYIFDLRLGTHTLVASSETGKAEMIDEFVVSDGSVWAVVDFWYYPDSDSENHFTIQIQSEPIYFM